MTDSIDAPISGYAKVHNGVIVEVVRGRSDAPLGFIPIHTVMDSGFNPGLHRPDKRNISYELNGSAVVEKIGYDLINLESARRVSIERLAAKRYEVETGGYLWRGYLVDTDRESQAKLQAAFQLAVNGLWPQDAGWKFRNEFKTLTSNELTDLAITVLLFVQGCYSKERLLAEQVNSANDLAGLRWIWLE